MRNLTRNLMLSLATFAVMFVIAELAVRKFDQMENLGEVVQFDPVLGWSLTPNGFTRAVDRPHGTDYRISINSLGMRETEFPVEKRAGRPRIVHIGDSVAFGLGVGNAWRCSDFMARALKGQVEVLNAGVPGWGTDQEVLQYENFVRTLHPDILILTFTMINDVLNNALDHLFLGTASKPRFELQDGKLVLANKVIAPKHRLRDKLRKVFRKSQFLVFVKRRLRTPASISAKEAHTGFPVGFGRERFRFSHWSMFLNEDPPEIAAAWDVTDALLARLHRECEAAGTKLIVFVFPMMEADDEWLGWLLEGSGTSRDDIDLERPFKRLEKFCRSEGIDYVYPIETFRERAHQQKLYLERDGHPNEYGHALAARVLLDYLRNHEGINAQLTKTDAVFVDTK